MKKIADCLLYGILDLACVAPAALAETAEKMIAGGVDILQLRAKNFAAKDIHWLAEQIDPITRAAEIPLIINDHPEVAAEIAAQGVHVGQDDIAASPARMLAGKNSIVGKSTHSIAQALTAQEEGADYIGFGPLFATPTKPDYPPIGLDDIARVHELIRIPIFCIGGIKVENLERILAAGARRVVLVTGILKAPDITAYTRDVKALLTAHRG